MLTENCNLRAAAYSSLTKKWGMAVLSFLVYGIIGSAVGLIPVVNILSILIMPPMSWGIAVLFLDSFRGSEIRVESLFDSFRKDYGRILGTMLLRTVYIFLWSLLLVFPGIIKYYSYAMTPFILKDNQDVQFNEAIEKSMEMMRGKKMKLFLLDLSFIGWILLCILTLGIGFLWLAPYMASARAAFYEDLKKETV